MQTDLQKATFADHLVLLRNLLVAFSALCLVGLVGCSDDDAGGTDSGTNADASTGADSGGTDGGSSDSGTSDMDSAVDDGSLTVPVTVTMMTSGFGGTLEGAAICQNFVIGGFIGFSLQPSGLGTCIGGAAYVQFLHDPTNSTYRIIAGEVIPDVTSMPDDYTPVNFEMTTVGTITDGGASESDSIEDLAAGSDITVTAGEYVLTVSFSGSDVTVTQFDER